MQNSYVEIRKFFNSSEDRTIEKLSCYYGKPEELYKAIKQMITPHLTSEQIKGKSILLKPNFVMDNRKPTDEICLFTNPQVIFATLRVLLEFGPQKITIGDAPIQDCNWDLMLDKSFYDTIDSLSRQYAVPIKVVDFRKVVFYPIKNEFGRSLRTDDDYLVFDVAERSWLEPITSEKNTFRVTNYNPDRMSLSHAKGMHRFCVAKEIFESDIVITMPKTKTHRMACLTNSLKILVGMNGDKDYLPHHRIGSKSQGGDCYKDKNMFRTIADKVMDFANRHRGELIYRPTMLFFAVLWKLGKPNNVNSTNGGWYGNDTVWRMVMDLNTIALYGKKDGTLAQEPQRTLYTLCDAIIGGQGSGPLEPDPLALGLLSFSNDPYAMDEAMGYVFGLNVNKIPLLNEAAKMNKEKEIDYYLDGKKVNIEQIKELQTEVILAPGWVDYNKEP